MKVTLKNYICVHIYENNFNGNLHWQKRGFKRAQRWAENLKCDYKLSKSYSQILLWSKCPCGIPERRPQNPRVMQNIV
jgi:hypothetical protein